MEYNRLEQPVTQQQFEKFQDKVEYKEMTAQRIKAEEAERNTVKNELVSKIDNAVLTIKNWILVGVGASVILPLALHYIFPYLDKLIK